jgi:hypothetical protein
VGWPIMSVTACLRFRDLTIGAGIRRDSRHGRSFSRNGEIDRNLVEPCETEPAEVTSNNVVGLLAFGRGQICLIEMEVGLFVQEFPLHRTINCVGGSFTHPVGAIFFPHIECDSAFGRGGR